MGTAKELVRGTRKFQNGFANLKNRTPANEIISIVQRQPAPTKRRLIRLPTTLWVPLEEKMPFKFERGLPFEQSNV